MIDIKKFVSEGDELDYNGEKMKIQPLSVREQSKFAQLQAEKKFGEASEYLFIATLKKVNSDWAEDDILGINDRDFITAVTKKILEVNGLQTSKQNFPEGQEIPQKQ